LHIFGQTPNQKQKTMIKNICKILILFTFFSCSKEDNDTTTTTNQTMYFPPLTGTTWETQTISDLKWNQNAVQPLLDYLELKHSKSFIVLINGRIVLENYFNGHSENTNWYWASAGKTLTSTVTVIAQQENLLNINNKVSQYIGTGWTSETLAK
jgi:hypothetical protein